MRFYQKFLVFFIFTVIVVSISTSLITCAPKEVLIIIYQSLSWTFSVISWKRSLCRTLRTTLNS